MIWRWNYPLWGVFWHKKVEKILRLTWFYPRFVFEKSSFSTFRWKSSTRVSRGDRPVRIFDVTYTKGRGEEEGRNVEIVKKNLGKTMLPQIFFRPFYAKKVHTMGDFGWCWNFFRILTRRWVFAIISLTHIREKLECMKKDDFWNFFGWIPT